MKRPEPGLVLSPPLAPRETAGCNIGRTLGIWPSPPWHGGRDLVVDTVRKRPLLIRPGFVETANHGDWRSRRVEVRHSEGCGNHGGVKAARGWTTIRWTTTELGSHWFWAAIGVGQPLVLGRGTACVHADYCSARLRSISESPHVFSANDALLGGHFLSSFWNRIEGGRGPAETP